MGASDTVNGTAASVKTESVVKAEQSDGGSGSAAEKPAATAAPNSAAETPALAETATPVPTSAAEMQALAETAIPVPYLRRSLQPYFCSESVNILNAKPDVHYTAI